MIEFKHSGNFKKIEKFLTKKNDFISILHKYGKEGVNALINATPIDSGETAMMWDYKIMSSRRAFSISWYNRHIVDGVPVVILLQYGHATGNGAYIQGRDFINPTIQPIFDKIVKEVWREVSRYE